MKAARTENKRKHWADSRVPRDRTAAVLICWQHFEKTQCLVKVPFPLAIPTGASRPDPLRPPLCMAAVGGRAVGLGWGEPG